MSWMARVRFEPSMCSEVVTTGGPGGLSMALGDAGRAFVVADRAVLRLHGSWLEAALGPRLAGIFAIDADERLKEMSTVSDILDRMRSRSIRRDDWVVGFGGGMICDIASFAAAIWLRGVRLALVPTSLLCMADACLGGKTGVNFEGERNQIGAFYPAGRIVIDPSFLGTLPASEVRSGLGEALKTAIVSADRELRDLLLGPRGTDDSGWVLGLVERCLRAKAAIVSEDPLEAGPRMLLNLGHTFGHALESAGGFELAHGEAVAIGCITAARIAGLMGGDPCLAGEITSIAERLGLPVGAPSTPGRALGRFLERDKKTSAAGRTWVLPFAWGDCRRVLLDATEERRLLSEARRGGPAH